MLVQCIIIGIIAVLCIIPSMYYHYYYLNNNKKPERISTLMKSMGTSVYFILLNAVVGGVLIFISIKENASWVVCLRQQLVMSIAAIVAAIDFKVKKVPNVLVAALLLVWIVFLFISVSSGADFSAIGSRLVQALGGFLTGGLILFVCMLISRGGLGAGDVKLIAVLGLFYGMIGILNILFYSCLFAAVISIVLLAAKKLHMKDSVPMTPFILMALFTYTIMSI